jgi:hypothetical protein
MERVLRKPCVAQNFLPQETPPQAYTKPWFFLGIGQQARLSIRLKTLEGGISWLNDERDSVSASAVLHDETLPTSRQHPTSTYTYHCCVVYFATRHYDIRLACIR